MDKSILGVFHIYGLLIGVGIWAASEVSRWIAKKKKVDLGLVEQGFWWAVIPGLIGARLYHVIDLWDEVYWANPLQMIKVWEGGLGIWGAIFGGIVGIFVYAKLKKIDLLEILDIGVIGVPLAQAIGRWGNFFNGELYGKNGEPLFLYESVLDFLLFIVLVKIVIRNKSLKKGVVLGVYLVGYGVIRLFLEMFRPAEIVWVMGGIPVAQIISVIAIVSGCFIVLKRS